MMLDALAAVGDPDLRSALLFVRSQDRAVTVDDLAAHQGVHRNVARARLERLSRAKLVEPGFERRAERAAAGPGRPTKTYGAAPELAAIEFPERHYETLLGVLVDAVPRRGRRRRLAEVGAAFWRQPP